MGFTLSFGKKRKFRKLIGNYVSSRAKEKRVFEKQIERLDAQLRDKRIEQETYERLKILLEAKDLQQQQEEWAKIEGKIYNPLS
jgi:hypothetical protein